LGLEALRRAAEERVGGRGRFVQVAGQADVGDDSRGLVVVLVFFALLGRVGIGEQECGRGEKEQRGQRGDGSAGHRQFSPIRAVDRSARTARRAVRGRGSVTRWGR